MQAFTFHAPTEIVFGRGAQDRTAELVKKYGGSRVVMVFGGTSAVKSGLLDAVTAQLGKAGIEHRWVGGATPNPHLSFAREGVKVALAFKADFVLAVGGGSAIDAAKAIAHGAANPGTDIWKFWTREAVLTKSLPVGVVLTISAAGSETSASAVITNDETKEKRGLGTDFNRPRFAVMNPELTFTLPKYQIGCGIADIFMHTLDRYFSTETTPGSTASNETTDEIAEALLRTVIRNAPKVLASPTDYDAQSEIMWCGSLSHNGITGLGRTMDFSVHQLGHELSGRFDVAHGASLTTMWGAWARYVQHVNPERFARYGEKVWGAPNEVASCCPSGFLGQQETPASEAIEKTEAFFRDIGMPTCFTELNIGVQPDNVLEALAASCVFHGKRMVGSFKPLDKNDVLHIYRAANQ